MKSTSWRGTHSGIGSISGAMASLTDFEVWVSMPSMGSRAGIEKGWRGFGTAEASRLDALAVLAGLKSSE